jgi:hypothetical protein
MRPLLRFVSASLVVATLAFGSAAFAAAESPAGDAPRSAFDQPFAISSYTQGWVGAYDAAGLGGRARWEFFQHKAGVEVFGEGMLVAWPGGGERHDIPIGFNLYAPIALGSRVRIRPLAGFCAVFSFIEPAQAGAPPSNDVLFGVHGGAGLEVAMVGPFVWFVDAQAVWYLGHDRTAANWSGAVSGSLGQAVIFQPTTGVELAFGR